MVHEIKNFFGVYLLYCVNPKFKGRTYVGFTVDPKRRVKQHNLGSHKGGAHRTSGRGPWEMVLIIHGFPNQISALRFEWAWQNPGRSRRLRHLPRKKRKESLYEFKFRIVSEMLLTSPWQRLPLTIRWLKQDYQLDFDPDSTPPPHMPIVYGPVSIKRVAPVTRAGSVSKVVPSTKGPVSDTSQDSDDLLPMTHGSRSRCAVCSQKMKCSENTLKCLLPKCHMVSHTICLAKSFLGDNTEQLLPIEGKCPKCQTVILWGDLIRYKMGCYQNLTENQSLQVGDVEDDNDSGSGHWADELRS